MLVKSFFFFFFFFFFFYYLFLWIKFSFFFWMINFFFNSSSMTCIFLFDWVSLLFMSFVFLISGSVLFYSLGYMSGDLGFIRFFYFVFLFILSMVFFILMPDLICLMLGWDGLGLVSYCLIIYYNNNSSMSSGLITVFINRFGDVFLILSIGWFLNFGSWHFFLYSNFFDYDLFILIYLIFFASFTSSAQFPFCFWLPMAMSAPTPVSSLVHSSTLVTSGVYLVIRFNNFLLNFDTFFLMFISLLTMFISGLGACLENDLKKIIAFSTLSQLGFMFFIISFGCFSLCFIHLLIHAVFKSLLFLCCGFFIHCFLGVQDIRFTGGLIKQCPYVSTCFFVSSLCLCGFPFFSGFYSSDFVVEMVILSDTCFIYFFFFCLTIVLTLFYSFRLLYYLFFLMDFFFLCLVLNIVFLKIVLYFFYFFFLCLVVLLFFGYLGILFFLWVFFEKFYLGFFFFFFFFFFNVMFDFHFFCSIFYFYFFGSMWFLNYFSSSFFLYRFFNFSLFYYSLLDMGWLGYFVSGGLLNLFHWLFIIFKGFVMNSFFIMMFFFFFFFLFLL
uniref:NADH:ubiquinone reductase (H(+)-translocating) n=1 Tax=Sivaloka damnosus TaxID=568780 RepID=D8KZG9_SIVDA|nr:NADH dehydrogenase subunit 5 [Sivaloka damnosus]